MVHVRILTSIPAWGWETATCHCKDSNFSTEGEKINFNSWKVLGYFPFTGTIVACLKCVAIINHVRENKKIDCQKFKILFIRGIIEATGLAFVTLPALDFIVTIYRFYSSKANAGDAKKGLYLDLKNINSNKLVVQDASEKSNNVHSDDDLSIPEVVSEETSSTDIAGKILNEGANKGQEDTEEDD